jgi:hypothetical protein
MESNPMLSWRGAVCGDSGFVEISVGNLGILLLLGDKGIVPGVSSKTDINE